MYAEIEHKHLETFIVFLTAATSKHILIVGFFFFFLLFYKNAGPWWIGEKISSFLPLIV